MMETQLNDSVQDVMRSYLANLNDSNLITAMSDAVETDNADAVRLVVDAFINHLARSSFMLQNAMGKHGHGLHTLMQFLEFAQRQESGSFDAYVQGLYDAYVRSFEKEHMGDDVTALFAQYSILGEVRLKQLLTLNNHTTAANAFRTLCKGTGN